MIQHNKLITQLNQYRIRQNKRILWPDFQILHLVQQGVLLNNLHIYIQFFKLQVIDTFTDCFQDLQQLYQDFTHAAFVFPKRSINLNFQLQISNNKKRSLSDDQEYQSIYQDKNRIPLTLVLTKRLFAIDQVIKASHKLSICVIPLTDIKHLWGGVITFSCDKFQQYKQQNTQAQKRGNEQYRKMFEANRINQLKTPNRQTYNAKSAKRQKLFSNYLIFSAQKQQKISKQHKITKPSNNLIKINPLNITSRKQLLYIQIPLINNPQIPNYQQGLFKFQQIIFYGSWKEPIYGKKYESSQSDDEQANQQNNTIGEEEGNLTDTRLLSDVFNVYSMPFRQFDSFLDSIINPAQKLPNLKFKTNQKFFSALKRLSLASQKKQSQLVVHSKAKSKFISKYQNQSISFEIEKDSLNNVVFQTPSSCRQNSQNRELSQSKFDKTKKKTQLKPNTLFDFQMEVNKVAWTEYDLQNIFVNKNNEVHSLKFMQNLVNQKLDVFLSIANQDSQEYKHYDQTKQQRHKNQPIRQSQRVSLQKQLDLDFSHSQNDKIAQNNINAHIHIIKELDLSQPYKYKGNCKYNNKQIVHFSVLSKNSFKPTYIPIVKQKLQGFTHYYNYNQKFDSIIAQIQVQQKEELKVIQQHTIQYRKQSKTMKIFILEQNYPIQIISKFEQLIFLNQRQQIIQFLHKNINVMSNPSIQFRNVKLLLQLVTELKLVVLYQMLVAQLIKIVSQNNQNMFNLIKEYNVFKQQHERQNKIIQEFHKLNQNQQFFVHFCIFIYENINQQSFVQSKKQNPTQKLKISKILNDFFLLHAKTIIKRHSLQFNFQIKKTVNKFGNKSIISTIQHCLSFYQDIPYEFLASSLQASDKKCQAIYLDTISELLNILISINDYNNILELTIKENQKITSSETTKAFYFIQQFGSLSKRKQSPSLMPNKIINVYEISNKQEKTNKNQFFSILQQSKMKVYSQYKVSYDLTVIYVDKSLQQLNLLSQTIKIRFAEFSYPFNSNFQSFNFVLSLKKNNTKIQPNFVLSSQHDENYYKQPSFEFKMFKSFETIIQIIVNQKYTFVGKVLSTFYVDTPTKCFVQLLPEPSSLRLEQISQIKRIDVTILMKKSPVYDCCLMFLNLRLPNYIKKCFQNQKQHSKNIRKTEGNRITEHLNRRQSVLAIQNEMFLTEEEITQLQGQQKTNHRRYSVYDLPQSVLLKILSLDRNYMQNQQKLFKFVMSYYLSNANMMNRKVCGNALLMCIRYRFISLTTLMKHYLDQPLEDNIHIFQQILEVILFQGGKKIQIQDYVGNYLIDRPRISTQKMPKTKQETEEEAKLILQYMKRKKISKN